MSEPGTCLRIDAHKAELQVAVLAPDVAGPAADRLGARGTMVGCSTVASVTWRFAGVMLAQTVAILGGVLATLRLLER